MLSPLPAHVRTARLVAVAAARRAGLDDELVDELRLAVGEACSRAVGLHETEWEDFASTNRDFQERSGRGRFRYVSELYLATALYYSNRFGRAEADEARERLFSWAYALRVQLTRVQFASVDNLARRPDSAFWLIRGASSPSELRRLVPPSGARLGRDPRLVDALAQLGSA